MTVRKRRKIRKTIWHDGHVSQLKSGWDFMYTAWGDRLAKHPLILGTWNLTLKDMRKAYLALRDQVMEGYSDLHPGKRPWAWWQFESSESRDETISEMEQLDRRGLLTGSELEKLREQAHGIRNECHETPFRRDWGWWRFLSPQCRNWEISEIEQLSSMRTELTEREQVLLDEKREIYAYNKTRDWGPCISNLTDEDLEYLGIKITDEK
jgi:hypothetical protein